MRDFNAPGHWYTSYPSLNHWTEDFGHREFTEALGKFHYPLHLYIHIPFCKKLCHYCICNIIISNDRAKIQHFLDHLLREIELYAPYMPFIQDIHLGGGTPSHLDRDQFAQLAKKLQLIAPLRHLKEVAMEIDPRTVTQEDLHFYADYGVNRISFGVQDFDIHVQEAINRVQPPEMIENLLQARHRFEGVNFDLLYGLPKQTMQTFSDTLDRTVQMAPERITLLKYCHAPDIRKHMKLINVTDLPGNDDLKAMFEMAVERLCKAGYIWIGLDHFAKAYDSLHKAIIRSQEKPDGYLARSFNGFAVGGTNHIDAPKENIRVKEMIGLGPTSTGVFGDVYCQSHYDLNAYYAAINRGEFPVLRGYHMTADDKLRRDVIFRLLCTQEATIDSDYFSRELEILSRYEDLCEVESGRIIVTCKGRYVLRNICKIFDVKDTEPQHNLIAQKNMIRRVAA